MLLSMTSPAHLLKNYFKVISRLFLKGFKRTLWLCKVNFMTTASELSFILLSSTTTSTGFDTAYFHLDPATKQYTQPEQNI